MSSNINRFLYLELTVSASQPELLDGLEYWLQLGLLDDGQVKQLSQRYLTCTLPEPILKVEKPKIGQSSNQEFAEEIPISVPRKRKLVAQKIATSQPSEIEKIFQSFKDELSLRWLFFLGIFLVIVSSGVMAATQWQEINSIGQYGILYVYTLIFGLSGWWTGKNEKLQLTSQTLTIVALLLIPINFVAMDSFGLWRNLMGWPVIAIAAISLSIMTFLFSRKAIAIEASLFLGLCYLHWGWTISNIPLLAIYLGTIPTAILLRRKFSQAKKLDLSRVFFVLFALTILFVRGTILEQLPLAQLGLAIGIGGWICTEIVPFLKSYTILSKILEITGILLILFGWKAGIFVAIPWQSLVVSGLGFWCFLKRLKQYWHGLDLLALFAIGAQGFVLLTRLIPLKSWDNLFGLLTNLTGYENIVNLFIISASFGYSFIFIGYTRKLYRLDKPKLAYFGEGLALTLGSITCLYAAFIPSLRSLSFLFWAISFLMVAHRVKVRPVAIYLAHLSGAIAILAIFPWLFPQFTTENYAVIFLIWAIAEWIALMGLEKIKISNLTKVAVKHLSIWSLSCWHLGFIGAIGSYFCSIIPDTNSILPEPSLEWLLIPLTLTVVSRVSPLRNREAVFASAIALFAVQFLLLRDPFPRLIGLGVATGLTIAHTDSLKRKEIAFVGIGYGLGLGIAIFWQQVQIAEWLLMGAIAVAFLWGGDRFLQSRSGNLAKVYREAADIWAIILTIALLTGLTTAIAVGYRQPLYIHWALFIAPIVLTGAIAFRSQSKLTEEIVWGVVWGLELIISSGLLLVNASILTLAAVNILIGFCIAVDRLVNLRSPFTSLNTFRLIPLFYAVLGLVMRGEYFTPYTGFLTLGAALTGLAIAIPCPGWQGLSYLSLAGISAGLYELTIYQMSQGSGGSPIDGLTILAAIAVVIAVSYRSLVLILPLRNNKKTYNLRRKNITIVGNIHWAIANIFMLFALGLSLNSPSQLRLLGTIIWGIIALYAILQGRGLDKPKRNDLWVILGVIAAGILSVYLRLFWPEYRLVGVAVVPINCAIALALYSLPWHRWGWRKQPWQYCAIAVPIIVLFGQTPSISTLNLLTVAAFYIRVAQQSKNWRWTYFALGLCNWAIARFFQENHLQDPLWYVSLASLSIIYISQFDPALQDSSQSKNRHLLRVIGSSLTCIIALVLHSEMGLVPILIGLLAILIGLGVKVRAFLYVGTITFLFATSYQLIVLIFHYAFLKWAIGLVSGIILIIVAANFERSRDRVSSTLQNWLTQLNTWE
ncbi:hypothetical protein [Spirulina sp. 06S082]|uniref:hypothetical protein n=1 Tax=Spirulina sp. 06S082 TaxID=3110248 RepID=UPI002B20B5F6|nr:hypothetical protein [Spirulina sp. 06S082]MEA5470646.1 hypothetical protein [Spirulina sp. 06S082]